VCNLRSLLRCLLLIGLATAMFSFAPAANATVTQFGAQVWIERADSCGDRWWFATLEEKPDAVARLFMMWSYLEPQTRYMGLVALRRRFSRAELHMFAIVATLTPSGRPSWMAGTTRRVSA